MQQNPSQDPGGLPSGSSKFGESWLFALRLTLGSCCVASLNASLSSSLNNRGEEMSCKTGTSQGHSCGHQVDSSGHSCTHKELAIRSQEGRDQCREGENRRVWRTLLLVPGSWECSLRIKKPELGATDAATRVVRGAGDNSQQLRHRGGPRAGAC